MSGVTSVEGRTLVPRSRSLRTVPLFREEIMAERQTQWLGTVLLEPRLSHRMFSIGAGLVAAAIVALLLFGSYTRKEHVNGWLVPKLGVVRVAAPQPGVVTQIKVSDGATVTVGDPLLVLSAEVHSQSSGPVREEVVQRLRERRDSLLAEKTAQESLFEEQTANLTERVATLRSQSSHLTNEITLQEEAVELSERVLARLVPLRKQGLVTEPRIEAAEQDRLGQAAKLQTLQQSEASLDRTLSELEGTLRQLPLQRSVQRGELDRNVAAIEQELAEAEARREVVITAPQDGIVTNLQATLGSTIRTDVPLLNIMPTGSILRAEIFCTSRSIGFVHLGQQVLLRYQAYPYQKFGFYEGTVASISRSAVSPSELPQQLSGLSSLYTANEPIYEITVEIAKQTATAYGEAMPLKAGMQLSADILIERRKLIEWVLDPLFSLTGGWR